jgi:Ca-activated chloride channel family protein
MNCKQIHPLLTQYLLGDLDAEQSTVIDAHLAGCEACRAERDVLEPTLALLSEALAEPVVAPQRLSASHRKRILYPSRTLRVIAWVGESHPRLAVAAGLVLVCGVLWLLTMPAMMSNRQRARHAALSVAVMDGEGLEAGDAIELEYASEVMVPMEEVEEIEELGVAEVPERIVNTYSVGKSAVLPPADLPAPEPTPEPKTVRPAEFDSVAIVKSPVVMNGAFGARSPAARGRVTEHGKGADMAGGLAWSADDISLAIVDGSSTTEDAGGAKLSSGVPDLDGIPVVGRLSTTKPRSSSAPGPAGADRGESERERAVSFGFPPASETAGPASGTRQFAESWDSLSLEGESTSLNSAPDAPPPPPSITQDSDGDSDGIAFGDEAAGGEKRRWGWLSRKKKEKASLSLRRREKRTKQAPLLYDEVHALAAAAPETKADATRELKPTDSLGGDRAKGSGDYLKAIEGAEEESNQQKAGQQAQQSERERQQTQAEQQIANAPVQVRKVQKKRKAIVDRGDDREVPDEKRVSKREESLRRLDEIRIPELDFRQAKVADVVDFFKHQSVECGEKDGKVVEIALTAGQKCAEEEPVADPFASAEVSQPATDGPLVTFSAKDISLKEALDITADVSGMKYEVDENGAITMSPKSAPEEDVVVAEPVVEEEPDEDEDLPGRFKAFGVNPFVSVAENAFSTFAIDVDTAAYTLGRNYMLKGFLPPAESVRTEEYVNFFDYAYKAPTRKTFQVYAEVAPSKFGRGMHLLKIGVKGRRLGREEQRRASLTFLIDTSGSMNQADRLGLVQKSLRLLVNELNADDVVTIVQYDSHARTVLAPTGVSGKDAILKAIDSLQCGGSTNLEEGMHRAYSLAAANFIPKGENRVLLLSDGVANLGSGAAEDILAKVEGFRRQGITCSVFGFGMGTYDDTMLETLANKGDGTYTFIDSEAEARRVFVDDLSATLNTIATDVKIQVEYSPDHVVRYRQLGYENRQLKKEDFRNDAIDAGEVGSGQSVTALYEMEFAAAKPVLYGAARRPQDSTLATVRVRYRRIDTGAVEEIEHHVGREDVQPRFDAASTRFKLATGVAEFSEILRGSPFARGTTFQDVAAVLRPVGLELSLDHHVQELLRMVEGADGMSRGR